MKRRKKNPILLFFLYLCNRQMNIKISDIFSSCCLKDILYFTKLLYFSLELSFYNVSGILYVLQRCEFTDLFYSDNTTPVEFGDMNLYRLSGNSALICYGREILLFSKEPESFLVGIAFLALTYLLFLAYLSLFLLTIIIYLFSHDSFLLIYAIVTHSAIFWEFLQISYI